MVRDRTGDRLPDPPGRIGAEFVASAILILVDRTHQAGIALLNQIQKAQSAIAILLGDRDHQTQIGAGKVTFGLLVPGKDPVHRTQLLPQLLRCFQDQVLQSQQLPLDRFDIIGRHHVRYTDLKRVLQLLHLLADAV